jgi:oligopeptide/dipeptide ABC transporter ATP-binding protein
MLVRAVSAAQPLIRLLELAEIRKEFGGRRSLFGFGRAKAPFRALNNVSLTVHRQEIVGLVGESGCGKSTLAQVAIRLLEVDGGSVGWKGHSVTGLSPRNLRGFRRGVQMVFQDTGSSLNPRKSVQKHLFETLAMIGMPRAERPARAHELLTMVGLDSAVQMRLPHQLSGGQRQRLGIARALAMQPELIIADEPVASLDVSLQAQIVNLLGRLRQDLGLAMLFISHDLALVGRISDRVAVMFAGSIVEEGLPQDVLHAPAHPYTRALLDAIPRGLAARDRPRKVHAEASALPEAGCRFAPRCPMARDLCRITEPPPVMVAAGHFARCHFTDQAGARSAPSPVMGHVS